MRPRGQFAEISAPSCFEEEPNTTLGLIDPVLKETRSGNVACIVAKTVHCAHAQNQSLIILSKFTQHIGRVNIIRVIVRDALETSNVSDGTYRRSTDLPYAFSDLIGDVNDLIRVFIEEKMVVAKMRSAHVPMEVLCLQVKGEHVREESVESSGDVLDCLKLNICWCC